MSLSAPEADTDELISISAATAIPVHRAAGGPGIAVLGRMGMALDRALVPAEHVFLWLGIACFAAMLVLNIANLAGRNLLGIAIPWAWPWTAVLFIWTTFFSFFVMYRRRLDVNVELLLDRLPANGRFAMRIVISLLALLFVGVILRESSEVIRRQVGVIDFVGLDRYWQSVPLLASCAMIAVHFLADILLALGGEAEHRAPTLEDLHPAAEPAP